MKMTKNCCRLCFEEKFRPIGIFTTKGIRLKIVEIIQKHFPDEISENDIFPKFVCADCWTKLESFHEFYSAVDTAKSIFLKKCVKAENPSLVEINCDFIELDGEFHSFRDELVDYVDPATPEGKAIKTESQSNLEKIEYESRDHSKVGIFATDGIGNESDEDGFSVKDDETCVKHDSDGDRTMHGVPSAASVATELTKKIFEYSGNGNKTRKTTFDDLVSKYLNMNCELCNHPLATLPEARAHYRSIHDQRSVLINCCDRRLRASNIRDHLRYHMNPDLFKCKVCNKQFVVKSNLKSHMQKHLPKEYECDVCKKKFGTRDNIRVHILGAHTAEMQQYVCHVCTKRFDTKSGLNQHVRNVHERIGEVVCHICAKVYNSKVNLRAHLLDHADVPPPRVTCEICGNSFKSEQNRIRHVKRHQEKGVPCPHCHKISPNRNALKSHIVSVHSKPMLECHLCDKKFKRTLALTEHVATHTGEDLYSCAYCSQRFKYHSSLYLHYRGVHPIEWNTDRKTKAGRQNRAEKIYHP